MIHTRQTDLSVEVEDMNGMNANVMIFSSLLLTNAKCMAVFHFISKLQSQLCVVVASSFPLILVSCALSFAVV